jgi:hypothetical protein
LYAPLSARSVSVLSRNQRHACRLVILLFEIARNVLICVFDGCAASPVWSRADGRKSLQGSATGFDRRRGTNPSIGFRVAML